MGNDHAAGDLITELNVTEHIRSSVDLALARQQLEVADETIIYVVNLLRYYSRGDHLFTRTEDGVFKLPLAALYMRAVDANALGEQQNALRRLGDVALIASSLCATGAMPEKAAYLDYYLAMGGGAYGFLVESASGTARERLYRLVFGELSTKFRDFVDVLAEVIEGAHLNSLTDVLRLYECWARTGSTQVANRLRHFGIEPCGASVSRLRH